MFAACHNCQVVEEYKGHDSIAYGADWYKGQWAGQALSEQQESLTPQSTSLAAAAEVEATTEHVAALQLGAGQQQSQQQAKQVSSPGACDIIATCSFYDRRLHLWSPRHTAE